MSKFLIVAGFEFNQTVKRWQFLLMTLGLPIFILFISWLSLESRFHADKSLNKALKGGSIIAIANLPKELNLSLDSSFIVKDSCPEISSNYLACLNFKPDWLKSGQIELIANDAQILGLATSLSQKISDLIKDAILKDKLAEDINKRLKNPSNLELMVYSNKQISPYSFSNLIIPVLFTIIFILSLSTASTFLFQSISEEKENRTMEILLSSISDLDLIFGKVLGLGGAALIQVFTWVLLAFLITPSIAKNFGISIDFYKIPITHYLLAILILLLGFLLYAAIMVGVGSLSANYKDSQQMASGFLIASFLPLYVLQIVASDLNGSLAFALGLFPLTSPMVIILRFCLSDLAAWDLALSLICLALGVVVCIWLAIRCFRLGSLNYQRRLNFKEVFGF